VVVSVATMVGVIGIMDEPITVPDIPAQGTTAPAIGMPFTTVPPPAVTTPLVVLLVSTGLAVPGIGIGVGTAVPGAGVAGITTVPVVADAGVL
jgi:hypothetical protein